MYKVSIIPSIINIEALSMHIFNLIFMIKIHPYIFNEYLPKIEFNDICTTSIYPDILIQILSTFSFTASILYCMDYGFVFFLNLIGYTSEYDMISPWKSYSLKEFWGKRWNQFVAYELRLNIYKPIIKQTNNRQLSIFCVFLTLAIIHAIPMKVDGFGINTVIIAFTWFIIQPFLLFIEEKLILPFQCGKDINYIIHSLLTFILLFGSFFMCLQMTCYANDKNILFKNT